MHDRKFRNCDSIKGEEVSSPLFIFSNTLSYVNPDFIKDIESTSPILLNFPFKPFTLNNKSKFAIVSSEIEKEHKKLDRYFRSFLIKVN